jgi:hypothetical protein
MQEKRRYERFTVNSHDLQSSMVLASHVQVLDISEGGISLKADLRLNIGRQYTLTIKSNHNASTVKGIIVWSSLVDHKEDSAGNSVPIYEAGLQFTHVSREAIDEIIGALQDKNPDFNQRNNSVYVDFGLASLDIQEEDQAKLEKVIESLH